MTIDELDTPCLLIDLDRLESNIATWQARVTAAGSTLRPHIKTHKSPLIAQRQIDAGAVGITAAKLSEAEVFVDAGITDVFVAYPIMGPIKWRHAAALAQRCRLIVGVDSVVGARGLSAAAVEAGSRILVRVEIEAGLGRSGVSAERAAALCDEIGRLPGLELEGIFAYRSTFFPGAAQLSAAQAAADEGRMLVTIAGALRAAGHPITSVSAGSTPTALGAAAVPGVTEVRPGTYVFGDAMMATLGALRHDEIALSILCTVVSRPAADRATIDGGSKTFGGDIPPAMVGLPGYACAMQGDAWLERMSEEHGVVRLGPGTDPAPGTRLAFAPIHVCTTVNLSDVLIGVRGGVVAQCFPVAARGKRE
jgi:D-serine deaminase-like pyridoxal phosphate-dependent protein